MVIRNLPPAFLTLPSRIVPTLSSRPISPTLLLASLYFITDVLAITFRPRIDERVLMISSVRPSAKYSSCWSELMIASGRAATLRGSRASFLVGSPLSEVNGDPQQNLLFGSDALIPSVHQLLDF